MFRDRHRVHLATLMLGDLVLVIFAYLLAFWVRASLTLPVFAGQLPESRYFEVDHLFGLLLGAHVVLLYSFGLFDERLFTMNRARLVRLGIAATALEPLVLVGYRYFTNPLSVPSEASALYFPRSVYLMFFPLNAAATILWRFVLLAWLRRRLGALRVAVVGTGSTAAELVGEIRRRPETGLEVAGVLEEEPGRVESTAEGRLFCGVPVLGTRDEIVEVARRERIAEIIVASADGQNERLLETLACADLGATRVSIIPGLYELLIGKVHRLQVHDIPLVEVLRDPASPPAALLKRLFDLSFAAALAVLLAPLAAAAALLVRFSDGGPVLYRQERVGRHRRPFTLYKFRTMEPDAEAATGPVLSGSADARVTSVGGWLRRYRVDELPQLWNVLRGEMSLVGPRPERPFFVERFAREIPGYAERFRVKPGLTGLAQVRATYATSPQNKLRHDLAYLYNQSLWLDLAILAETIKEVLNSRSH